MSVARFPSRAVDWWPIALIIAAGVVAYANSFTGAFVFDDLPAITENATIRQWSTALTPPANGSSVVGRPLVNLSFAINYAIGGDNPTGYHVANLLVHLLAALTLYGVIWRTLVRTPPRPPPSTARLMAFGATLLWTVHPLQTESVTFIVQRTESLVGLFLLLTLYAFIRTADPPRSRAWPALTFLACLAGMATKELMVVAPLLVLLYDRTFVAGSFAAAWRQRRVVYLALASTWLLLGWLVFDAGGNRGGTSGFATGVVTPWQYLLTQCEAIGLYLKLSFWPDPLVVDYGIGIVTSLGEVLPQALLLVALATAGTILVWRQSAWGFVAAWFFVILAPSSSVVPLATQTIAEHRMYLPLAALTTAAALGFHVLLRTRSVVLFLAIGALFVALTLRRNPDYANGITLWTDTVNKVPHSARAHNNFGKVLHEAGRYDEAFARFLEAARLNPTAPDTQANLGLSYERFGRRDRAEAHYREAIRLQPTCVTARINLGALLIDTRRLAEALPFVAETVRLLPHHPQAHINHGVALLELQRPRDAIAPLEQAVTLAPDDPQAHGNLANALSLLDRRDEAATHYESALRLEPDYAIAHENYGLLLLRMAQPHRAVVHFEAAVRLRPDNVMAKARLEHARQQAANAAKTP